MIGTQIEQTTSVHFISSIFYLATGMAPSGYDVDGYELFATLSAVYCACFFIGVGTGEMVAGCSSKNHLYYLGYPVHVFR